MFSKFYIAGYNCIKGYVAPLLLAKSKQRMPLVDQELLTLPEHLSSPRI
jgi:hypothetical protein